MTSATAPDASSHSASMRLLLSRPTFRLFWTAVAVSSFGDPFFTVALPWLVLQLGRSDVALGSVLMTAALPRSALMLAGGALSDRLSPARMLLYTYVARAVLVGGEGALVAAGLARLWHLYPLAVVFGVLDALSRPASTAIVPVIAGNERLYSANAFIQSTAQVGSLIAPTLAGALIASGGISASLIVSAVASAMAGAAFAMMPRAAGASPARDAADDPRLRARDGTADGGTMAVLRASLRDPALRAYLVLIAASSLATSGPLAVGIPSLARVRFSGSVSLGVMLSASAAGTLVGALLAGSRRRVRHRGALLLGVNALVGVLLLLLAYAPDAASACLLIGIMSCASSFVNVIALAVLQGHADRAVLGRLMAIVMLASVGLSPVSYLLAGLASAVDPTLLFWAAAAVVMMATVQAAIGPALRRLD